MKSITISLLVAVFFFISSRDAAAQSETNPAWAKYAIQTDLGLLGYGGAFTANFEMRIWNNNKNLQLRARSGYGYAGLGFLGDATEVWGAPLGITALFGKKTHFFEVALGGIFGYSKRTSQTEVFKGFGVWPLADIGYRFELAPTGIILRAKIGTSGIGGGIGVAF